MRVFNLAEELEKERKINKVLTEEVLKYEMSNKQLQDRINSAINYIEKIRDNTPSSPRKDIARMILLREDMLLDILKGE